MVPFYSPIFGEHGVMEKKVYEVRDQFMSCSVLVSVSRIYSYVCLYSPLYCCRINLAKQMSHNNVIMICTFSFVIWFVPFEFLYQCFLFNHKNYNFLACDWFKNALFSTNSLAKLLSDSLFMNSLLLNSLLYLMDYK